ncbi:tRNA-specific 2-thiouridylase MnmA [Phycisphaerales bacterium]|nr:tRNA-specific 2-thiouridylase MnmA [Phycisphaerales bacterium]
MSASKPKVLVAMSGGVDSSVAATMLVRAGYDAIGCFMRLGSPGESLDEMTPGADACPAPPAPGRSIRIGHQGCCSINDAADARLVAAELGIPFYVCNFKKDFGRIIDYFVDEYAQGRTPNPCVRCNDWLKFGKLRDYAAQVGAEFVASGHYARIGGRREDSDASGPRLMRGRDGGKDQSYVLFGMPRDQLSHTLFPIGDLPKSEVRARAKEWGLPVFDKPDSQEICFVPDNDYAGLVERRRPGVAARGEVLDLSGRRLGEHAGQHKFTIGQRRGVPVALGTPVYIVSKDPANNSVTVGAKSDLLVASCRCEEANWLRDAPAAEVNCLAQYRYNSDAVLASVSVLPRSDRPTASGRQDRFEVRFETPQEAVAPGQALVLYDASEPDVVLGGGWIASTARA